RAPLRFGPGPRQVGAFAGPRAVGRAFPAGRPRLPAGTDGCDWLRRIPPRRRRRHARGTGTEPADRAQADRAVGAAPALPIGAPDKPANGGPDHASVS